MGAFGHKLYDDDDAQDARDSYQSLLTKGLDGPAATSEFLRIWRESLDDPDDGAAVWLALADTQWRLGRLEDRVRDRALALVDSGSSLDRWREAGPKVLAKREKVLLELKRQLLSPQPPRKAIRVKLPSKIATWPRGELFAYRLLSGRQVVLCLEEIDENHHGRLSALDWIGDEAPDAAVLATLPRKTLQVDPAPPETRYTHWHVLALRKKDVPYTRMRRLEVQIPKAPESERYGVTQRWSDLDGSLAAFFDWR